MYIYILRLQQSMAISEYTRKMEDLLRDETYEKLKKDPTSQTEPKVHRALKKLEEKGCIWHLATQHPRRTMACQKSIRKEPHSVQLWLLLARQPIPWPRSWPASWLHCPATQPPMSGTQRTLWNASNRPPLRKMTAW